jgi:hypothetical protein
VSVVVGTVKLVSGVEVSIVVGVAVSVGVSVVTVVLGRETGPGGVTSVVESVVV